jgi:hypothetical protein
MEVIQLFRTMCPCCGSRLAIRIIMWHPTNKDAQWRVCFAGRRHVTMWWRTRQTDLGVRRSSIRTRILARRASLRPAHPRTRLYPFARIQAAVSASVAPRGRALGPTPTTRRGPLAVLTTLDPTIHPTAPPHQAGCRMARHTVTSLTACRLPTMPTWNCPGIATDSTLEIEKIYTISMFNTLIIWKYITILSFM